MKNFCNLHNKSILYHTSCISHKSQFLSIVKTGCSELLIFFLHGVKIRNFRKFSISLCREIELEEKIMIKVLLILLGLVCVALGALGVVTPGLPTTPLLLLASWSFYKSSPRLQQWLLRSALGKYIVEYQKKNGMTIRTLHHCGENSGRMCRAHRLHCCGICCSYS